MEAEGVEKQKRRLHFVCESSDIQQENRRIKEVHTE